MQKEITISELESTINSLDDIIEPIILKRNNKEDLIILSLEQYKKDMFLEELNNKLEQSENELKTGKVYKAREVFKELNKKYGY